MSNKDIKLREQMDRGLRAETALQELEKAFEALREDCFNTFANSDIHDDAGRRTCRIYLKVLDDVKTRFVTAVRSGDAAHKELIKIADISKRKVVNV